MQWITSMLFSEWFVFPRKVLSTVGALAAGIAIPYCLLHYIPGMERSGVVLVLLLLCGTIAAYFAFEVGMWLNRAEELGSLAWGFIAASCFALGYYGTTLGSILDIFIKK